MIPLSQTPSLLGVTQTNAPTFINTTPTPAPAQRIAFSDITNLTSLPSPRSLQLRHHSLTIGRKISIVNQVEKMQLAQGMTLATALDVVGIDRQVFVRYKQIFNERESTPTKQRRPLKRKRRAGAGRPPALTPEQDQELKQWILSLRRGPGRVRVRVKDIKFEARRRYGSDMFHVSEGNRMDEAKRPVFTITDNK
jgi:hypothetical protein